MGILIGSACDLISVLTFSESETGRPGQFLPSMGR
jgi:hypothetical protein